MNTECLCTDVQRLKVKMMCPSKWEKHTAYSLIQLLCEELKWFPWDDTVAPLTALELMTECFFYDGHGFQKLQMTLREIDTVEIKLKDILNKQGDWQLPYHNAVYHPIGIFQDSEPWDSPCLPSLPAQFPRWSPPKYEVVNWKSNVNFYWYQSLAVTLWLVVAISKRRLDVNVHCPSVLKWYFL